MFGSFCLWIGIRAIPGDRRGATMREPNARERRRLEQIAFHQAGHVVAAHALGVDFGVVSVFPDEFERGEHLPLASPNTGPDERIKILLAGAGSRLLFIPSSWRIQWDRRRDRAQIRGMATGLGLSDDELQARIY